VRLYSAEETRTKLVYAKLIEALRDAFTSGTEVPLRHHHNMPREKEDDATMLLMPAWMDGTQIGGVKIVNVTPGNRTRNIPAICASYLVFDEETGQHVALLDGTILTARRTAAASALAASYLARPNSRDLLVVGAGKIGNEIPYAYREFFDLDKVIVWNRTISQSKRLVERLVQNGFTAEVATDLETAVKSADIISAATLVTSPLIRGEWLRAGQHLDLIGSFTPKMREVDDDAMRRSKIFVDTNAAIEECGELIIPLNGEVITRSDILGSLYDLCQNDKFYIRGDSDITLFKGVGVAFEDLAAAKVVMSAVE
jgi:ornithine cyclodeaminase/alanine dehydrogenase-like protein (mu-crystallin family)